MRAIRVGLPLGAMVLFGCVGDAPTVTPQPDASTDAPIVTNDGGGGNDGSTTDAIVDAAPPPCGAPGESCCVLPQAPCGDGLTCTTDTKKCVVSDAWAIGEYQTVTSSAFVTVIVTAHYDGATWTQGKDVLVDTGFTTYRATDIHQHGGSVRALVTKASSIGGKMYGWNGVSWAECKQGNSCIGPTTNADLYAVTSVSNNGNNEYWIGGTNVMYRCPDGAQNCTLVTNGIVGSIGTSTFAGTTAQDLWYGALDHVLHYNGTTWASTSVPDAIALGDVAKDDIWMGYTKLRHWDGKAWSNAFLIDGANAPGNIYSIAGSGTNDVWAVGNGGAPSFAAHWDGTGWKKTTLPAGTAELGDVYAPSSIDAFVVGRKEPSTNKGVIAHWNGTAWTEMPSPTLTYPGETQAGTLVWVAVTGQARARRAP